MVASEVDPSVHTWQRPEGSAEGLVGKGGMAPLSAWTDRPQKVELVVRKVTVVSSLGAMSETMP